MTETTTSPLETSHIVHKVGTSKEYAKARNEAEALDLDDSGRRRAAIRMAATALSGEQASGYLTPDGHAMNITARLTDFSESIRELHTLQEQDASHEEKLPALRRLAEFNHAVKNMVDANPSLSFDEVLTFIMSMNQSINGLKSSDSQFEYEVTNILVGMRHEIAFEQMLGYMPDVEYKEATIEDDLVGADIFISINGSAMVPIDIKASQKTVQRKRDEQIQHGYTPNHIVWSQVTNDEFGGSFRIPHDIAQKRSIILHDVLLNTINSETVTKEQVA
jgi:hypothetical protein